MEEVDGKGVPSRLAIFHGVLVARKGFQRRTVLPEAVLQTRDKGSPVPRFRRRETAKALVPLLHLSLATRECGGNRRKESHEQTPSGCYAVSLFLPLPSFAQPLATVNSVNICLSCLTTRFLRPFRFLRGFLLLLVLVSAKYRELADARRRHEISAKRMKTAFEDRQVLAYIYYTRSPIRSRNILL